MLQRPPSSRRRRPCGTRFGMRTGEADAQIAAAAGVAVVESDRRRGARVGFPLDERRLPRGGRFDLPVLPPEATQHRMVSLAEVPLQAKRNDRLRWSPEAGLRFTALPGGPEPAAPADERQFQMRSLARKFTGYLADHRDEAKLTELRLMARPLHQYEATDGSGRAGRVFGLVTTTDPEILLLIEARRGRAAASGCGPPPGCTSAACNLS